MIQLIWALSAYPIYLMLRHVRWPAAWFYLLVFGGPISLLALLAVDLHNNNPYRRQP